MCYSAEHRNATTGRRKTMHIVLSKQEFVHGISQTTNTNLSFFSSYGISKAALVFLIYRVTILFSAQCCVSLICSDNTYTALKKLKYGTRLTLGWNDIMAVPNIHFTALTPLVGWQEGHPACKKSHTRNPQRFFFGTVIMNLAQPGVIFGKTGRLNKSRNHLVS